MTNSLLPTLILIVNVLTVAITSLLVVYTFRKCFILKLPSSDHIFYALKLKKCIIFFIFNSLTLYADEAIFDFIFETGLPLPYHVLFIRYAARATTFVYAWVKVLDCMKYNPTAYHTKIKTDEKGNNQVDCENYKGQPNIQSI